MRSQYSWALAPLLLSLPFCTNASPIYEFHATSVEAYRYGTVPAALSNASTWDIVGSIVLGDAGPDPDSDQIVGGSLSVNGISLGAFDSGHYRQGYFDEPPEPGDDPYYANFAISFNSEEYGHSFFSLYSEDYGAGDNYSSAQGYLENYPVGGYQSIAVSVGDAPNVLELVINEIDDGFVLRDDEGPVTAVPEPSSASLVAVGMACMIWLRRRRRGVWI
jgi:hypothetical protein